MALLSLQNHAKPIGAHPKAIPGTIPEQYSEEGLSWFVQDVKGIPRFPRCCHCKTEGGPPSHVKFWKMIGRYFGVFETACGIHGKLKQKSATNNLLYQQCPPCSWYLFWKHMKHFEDIWNFFWISENYWYYFLKLLFCRGSQEVYEAMLICMMLFGRENVVS